MSSDNSAAQPLSSNQQASSNTPIVSNQQVQQSSQTPQQHQAQQPPQAAQPSHYQQQQQPGMMPYQQQQQYPMSAYGSTAGIPQQANGQAQSGAARPYLGYPDQYQQYLQSVQQMSGANAVNSLQTGASSQQPGSTLTNAYQGTPYSYYMMNQQAANSALPQQLQLTQQQQQQPQLSQQQQQQQLQQPQQSQQQPDYSSYAYRGYVPSYPPAMYPTAGGVPSMQAPQSYSSGLSSTVGQIQPAGLRPRITTTMWEDEKTLCYQVDANGISVVRRADNNMINGTKLLNVAKMTRGRRDGILKSEKVRKVVKIGSMHLKGVWIPFERALAMAQREGIVDLLYPLFVKDIKRVIQQGTPTTSMNGSTSTSGAAATTTTTTGASGATGVSTAANPSSGNSASNGSISSSSAQQLIPQQQQTQAGTPLSGASSVPVQSGANMGSYSNMYYPNQMNSTPSEKLDSKLLQHPYGGYYQQQASAAPQQLQQPYYYYPTQMQQPYGGYGYSAAATTTAQANTGGLSSGAGQDGQTKIEPK